MLLKSGSNIGGKMHPLHGEYAIHGNFCRTFSHQNDLTNLFFIVIGFDLNYARRIQRIHSVLLHTLVVQITKALLSGVRPCISQTVARIFEKRQKIKC